MKRLKRLIVEVHRRSLWQVLLIYCGAALVAYQAVQALTEGLGLPQWFPALAVVLFIIGLPTVLAAAFVHEVTPPTVTPAEPTRLTEAEAARIEAETAAAQLEARRRHRFLTGRNAVASFVVALAAWGVVATGWLLFGDRGSAPEAERESIAVLPFENLSPDPDDAYFADGVHEEIIGQLGKIAALRVTSRTSVMEYKSQRGSLRTIAEELGVTNILEGTVRRAGDRVRITAQLINAENDEHLWSETYEREYSDIFAIQSEVSERVASALRAALAAEERERIKRSPTTDIEAHSLYLRGRYFWNRRTEDDLAKAIEYFTQAVERDPDYALAYAGLADSYNLLGAYGHLPAIEAFSLGRAAALRAIEIDSTLAEAHTAHAYVMAEFEYDWLAAERSYKRAIALNPSYATARQWYAWVILYTGRRDESIAGMREALRLDPRSLIINRGMGRVYLVARQYDRAVEQLSKTLEMDPDFVPARRSLGLTYALQSKHDDAIHELRTTLEMTHGEPRDWSLLGYVYALSGDRTRALAVLDTLTALSERRYVEPTALARVYVGLGDMDRALVWLNRAYEVRDPVLTQLGTWPVFDDLRSDPRSVDLLRRLGFQQ